MQRKLPYGQILYEVSDNILTITLNRPEKLNAFTNQMMVEMLDALDRADADDEVRAIIVTGAGRGFCAGADLSAGGRAFDFAAREDRPEKQGAIRPDGSVDWSNESVRDGGGRLTLRIFRCLKPIIAAVNGAAVGVGVTMQLPMDVRLAADDARFGFVFARRGLVPEACCELVPAAGSWDLAGARMDLQRPGVPAQEALEAGLVSKLYKKEELIPAARALAREIADHASPVSVALTRQMLWQMLGANHPMEAHKIDSRAIFVRGASADAKEGVSSFLEKRPAKFTNRVSKDMPSFFPWSKEPKYE